MQKIPHFAELQKCNFDLDEPNRLALGCFRKIACIMRTMRNKFPATLIALLFLISVSSGAVCRDRNGSTTGCQPVDEPDKLAACGTDPADLPGRDSETETRRSQSVPPNSVFVQKMTQEIIFGTPQTYTHKSGWFSMSVPSNWKVTDKSDALEVILSIADPTENGIMVIRVYQPGKEYSRTELEALVKGFLNERMGSFEGFSMGETKSQNDGSLGIYFKYDSKVENVTYKMNGDTFVEQHNGLVSVLTLIMPQDQYEAKQKAAYEMVNSFRLKGATR